MQEWTRWFREKQEAYGTIEDFARASGIKVRSVSDYRAGRIPRGPARAAIASVLGDSGPLPGRPIERIATLEERIAYIETRLDQHPSFAREEQDHAAQNAAARRSLESARDLAHQAEDRPDAEGDTSSPG